MKHAEIHSLERLYFRLTIVLTDTLIAQRWAQQGSAYQRYLMCYFRDHFRHKLLQKIHGMPLQARVQTTGELLM